MNDQRFFIKHLKSPGIISSSFRVFPVTFIVLDEDFPLLAQNVEHAAIPISIHLNTRTDVFAAQSTFLAVNPQAIGTALRCLSSCFLLYLWYAHGVGSKSRHVLRAIISG